MNLQTFVLFVFTLLFLSCDCDQPNKSAVVKKEEIEKGRIFVIGFVAERGPHLFTDGMTIEDALGLAGGYGNCEACAEHYPTHPTYRLPPNLNRDNGKFRLPKSREEWLKVKLKPKDLLEFRHILF